NAWVKRYGSTLEYVGGSVDDVGLTVDLLDRAAARLVKEAPRKETDSRPTA
ncbi:unnamed protein product, partial [marine sediment metagenome]